MPRKGRFKPVPIVLGQPGYRRHRDAPSKDRLRAWLDQEPINQYSIEKKLRTAGKLTNKARQRLEQKIGKQSLVIIEAAMALYDVPYDWPEDTQWRWLALRLLAERYRRCRTVTRAIGGAPTVPAEDYLKLSASFEAFRKKFEAKYGKRSGQIVGQAYLHENGRVVQVGPERLSSVSGLLNAVRRGKQIAAKNPTF